MVDFVEMKISEMGMQCIESMRSRPFETVFYSPTIDFPYIIGAVNVDVEGFIDVFTDLKIDLLSTDSDLESFEYLRINKDMTEPQNIKEITIKYHSDLIGNQMAKRTGKKSTIRTYKARGIKDLSLNKDMTEPQNTQEITLRYHRDVIGTRMAKRTGTKSTIRPYKVRDIKDLSPFAKHVYKRSLKTINKINKKLNKSLRSKMELLEQGYKLKFKQFINETLDYTVKTRTWPHKLILNTLQTSDHILRRLINHLIYNLSKDPTKRNSTSVESLLRSEIGKNSDNEYKYICKYYQICRTANSFSSFVIDVISNMASLKADKLEVANSAITEVLKETDVSKAMDKETESKYKWTIKIMESLSGPKLRPIYAVIKNILLKRYKPVQVTREKYIKNALSALPSEAIIENLDIFDKYLPANEENQKEWDSITKSLQGWREGKRNDILEICQRIVDQFKKAVENMDATTRKQLKTNFNKMFLP